MSTEAALRGSSEADEQPHASLHPPNPHGTSSGMAFSAVAAPRPDDAGDAPPCLTPKPGKPCSALPSACCALANAAAANVGGRTISIAAGRPRRPRPPAHRKHASTLNNNQCNNSSPVKAHCPGLAPTASGQRRCRRRSLAVSTAAGHRPRPPAHRGHASMVSTSKSSSLSPSCVIVLV